MAAQMVTDGSVAWKDAELINFLIILALDLTNFICAHILLVTFSSFEFCCKGK